ncbi:MAG: nitronate monooxygenase [Clostridia bacterium]
MNIPKLDIGGLVASVPIIQGAMGVGVSGASLAGAVAGQGGVGVIAGVGIGYREHDFFKNTLKANLRAMGNEIQKARGLAPKGILGVNLMVAMNNYAEMVKGAVEDGIDLIISGAGLPTKLPELVQGFKTRIAPIVSSSKAANIILKYWASHYGRTADMVVVEGSLAGGHLGFTEETLKNPDRPLLIDIIRDVLESIQPYEKLFNRRIPVIAAGGVYTGRDIAEQMAAGAAGVQMATRFVTTRECDAADAFKQAYLDAKQEDIIIIKSPVGMPGRALDNAFIRKVAETGDTIKGCYQCLRGCNPKVAPYCIAAALIHSVQGNMDDGLVFVGSNAYRSDRITGVRELMDELKEDLKEAL